MEFKDRKNDSNGSETKSSDAKIALDQYFEVMLGSIESNHLRKLENKKKSEKTCQIKPKLRVKSRKDKPYTVTMTEALKQSTTETLEPQSSKKILSKVEPRDFAEPSITSSRSRLTPLSFPKMTPVSISVKREPKLELKEKTQISVVAKQSGRVKLDAKTALAQLEALKSRLSKKQRLLLDQKLKAKAKTEIETEVKDIVIGEKIHVTQYSNDEKINLPNIAKSECLPNWAEGRFECLLFSVAGLKLAVPLISLGAIYKIENELTPLVGRADWFMGLYHQHDRNVHVVDTARWVMPNRRNEDVRQAYKFIIKLGDSDWGMACDAVHQSIQLEPSHVKWRTSRSKRGWLLGTVIDQMCALLDVDALAKMLK